MQQGATGDGLTNTLLQIKEDVKLAQDAGLKEVDEDDIEELLRSHSELLPEEDVTAIEPEAAAEEIVPLPPKELSIKKLSEIFALLHKAVEVVTKMKNSSTERGDVCRRGMENVSRPYKEVYGEKKV